MVAPPPRFTMHNILRQRVRPGPPLAFIDDRLGLGLSFDDWIAHLRHQDQDYTWNDGLKKLIVKREYEYFKSEIAELRAQENTGTRKCPSNCCTQILRRLKGEMGDKDERRENRRLFNPDGPERTMQNKVDKWRKKKDPLFVTAQGSSAPVASTPFANEAAAPAPDIHFTRQTSYAPPAESMMAPMPARDTVATIHSPYMENYSTQYGQQDQIMESHTPRRYNAQDETGSMANMGYQDQNYESAPAYTSPTQQHNATPGFDDIFNERNTIYPDPQQPLEHFSPGFNSEQNQFPVPPSMPQHFNDDPAWDAFNEAGTDISPPYTTYHDAGGFNFEAENSENTSPESPMPPLLANPYDTSNTDWLTLTAGGPVADAPNPSQLSNSNPMSNTEASPASNTPVQQAPGHYQDVEMHDANGDYSYHLDSQHPLTDRRQEQARAPKQETFPTVNVNRPRTRTNRPTITSHDASLMHTIKTLRLENKALKKKSAEKDVIIRRKNDENLSLVRRMEALELMSQASTPANFNFEQGDSTPHFTNPFVLEQEEPVSAEEYQQQCDQILREAKAAKEKRLSMQPLSTVSTAQSDHSTPRHRQRLVTAKAPIILELPTAASNQRREVIASKESSPPSFRPLTRSRQNSECTTSSTSTSLSETTRRLKKKLSDKLLGRHVHPIPPVPKVPDDLPPIPTSCEIVESAATTSELQKRFTADSGYASMKSVIGLNGGGVGGDVGYDHAMG